MSFEFYHRRNNSRQMQKSGGGARFFLITIYATMLLLPISFFHTNSVAQAATLRANDTTSSFADTVIIMDNIDLIKSHDPTGVRFSAAQLFADMAPRGDSIGVVRIPSSLVPNPVQLLPLQNIQSRSDRNLVKSKLSQSLPIFQTVDPAPTSYFVPALQQAGSMLNSAQDNNRKYIILVTDSVAYSGDPTNCPQSPDKLHRWFCTVGQLESEGISVILLGFTTPGPQAQRDLQPTKKYLEQHGGVVLQVDDGAGVPQVAEQYASLMTRIHPNVYETTLEETSGSVNINAADRLTELTFVAVGGTKTSLTQVQQPGGDPVAGKSSDDGTYYNASGTGYWLQTIATGALVGSWQLGSGASPPSEILVLGISEAHFDLLNPAPAANSDISQRFVVPGKHIVLRALVTGVDGNPLAGASFVANPNSDNQPFTNGAIPTSALPGNNTSDITAVLGVAALSTQATTLHIGLGSPLAGTTYLEKQFPIVATNALNGLWVQVGVPPTAFLKAGQSISISASGTPSTTQQPLAIFGRDASVATWTQINTGSGGNGTSISGLFPLERGCGATYNFQAVEEISGTLPDGGGAYDYLAFDQKPYTSQLQQSIAGSPALTSNKVLAPWLLWPWSSNQLQWNVTFVSTVCVPVNMDLGMTLQPNQFSSHLQMNGGQGTFTIAANTSTSRQITATLGSCPFTSLLQDRTDTVQIAPLTNISQGTDFIRKGDWDVNITCPSFFTYARGNIVPAIIILFILSIIVARLFELPILPLLPKKRLVGSASIVTNAAVLVGEAPPDIHTYTPMTVRIPGIRPSLEWFLVCKLDGADTIYAFERPESPLALLHFKAQHDENGEHVMMAATRYATGANLPEFLLTRTPVGQDFQRCDKGEPVVINHDIVYLDLDVAT